MDIQYKIAWLYVNINDILWKTQIKWLKHIIYMILLKDKNI